MGAMILGPRIGKYAKDGSVNAIPGHHMGYAVIGTFILWLGWFGFNPGSTMAADPVAIAKIAINTSMAAAAGAVVATFFAWLMSGKPDLSMILNGSLAGLVAITAPCANVTLAPAILIGAVGGVLVVLGVSFFDKLKIDDPVGALSVHLVNGIWGTLAFGLFSTSTGLFYGFGPAHLITQAIGIAAVGVFTVVTAGVTFMAIKAVMGLRVSAAEEVEGLDLGEHGMEAYVINVSPLADHSKEELAAIRLKTVAASAKS
jgi:Amt family ammonium transporter